MLLGSDVAYSLKALPSLFKTVAALLSKRPTSVFMLGYVSRSYTVSSLVLITSMCQLHRLLHACTDLRLWRCRAASIDRGICLEAAAVGLRTRMVAGTHKAVPGGLEGAVYEVK